MNKIIFEIKNLLGSFLELLQYLFSDKIRGILNSEINVCSMFIILGIIGLFRNILEVALGGQWARAWFSLKPDVLFTMFFYPVFLCFFSTTLLHFFSNQFGLKIKIRQIVSVLFLLQIVHLFIPLFDGLADFYNIPCRLYYDTILYKKLIFSPLALTPLILLFTWPTSLGIDIAWLFVSFILLKVYLKQFKFPVFESLAVLTISFYIIYMSIYPIYFFFINETIIGSNWMFGLFFIFMSIPSAIYVKTASKESR
jgi:hypothetical protein